MDARLPERWLLEPRMDKLSDRAWRIFCNALMYAVGQGSDGAIDRSAFRWLHQDGVPAAIEHELIAAGLWKKTTGGIQVTDWGKSQSFASVIESQRERKRENSKAYRGRKAQKENTTAQTATVTGDATGDATGDGLGKAGKARQGKAGRDKSEAEWVETAPGEFSEVTPDEHRPRTIDWPTATPGSGRRAS